MCVCVPTKLLRLVSFLLHYYNSSDSPNIIMTTTALSLQLHHPSNPQEDCECESRSTSSPTTATTPTPTTTTDHLLLTCKAEEEPSNTTTSELDRHHYNHRLVRVIVVGLTTLRKPARRRRNNNNNQQKINPTTTTTTRARAGGGAVDDLGNTNNTKVRLLPHNNKKTVTFSELHIREYAMILGDHPACIQGPPVTVDWEPLQSYTVAVEEYESQLVGSSSTSSSHEPSDDNNNNNDNNKTFFRRRNATELRMPAEVRHALVLQQQQPPDTTTTTTAQDVQDCMAAGAKVRHQRRLSLAAAELEGLQMVWQSCQRKWRRFLQKNRRHRKNHPHESLSVADPAAVWLQQHYHGKKSK